MDHNYPARPKRLKGVVYIGRIAYSLTICTDWRQRAFDDRDFARDSIRKLLSTAAKFQFALYAYCLMPDHGHIVALGKRDDSDLEKFMRSWTTQTGYAWLRNHRDHLWEGGYFDRILRSDVSIYFAAQYVVMNPVRAGIVDDPTKYEFSGSTVCTIAELMMR
jgi:putative transposase